MHLVNFFPIILHQSRARWSKAHGAISVYASSRTPLQYMVHACSYLQGCLRHAMHTSVNWSPPHMFRASQLMYHQAQQLSGLCELVFTPITHELPQQCDLNCGRLQIRSSRAKACAMMRREYQFRKMGLARASTMTKRPSWSIKDGGESHKQWTARLPTSPSRAKSPTIVPKSRTNRETFKTSRKCS